VVPRESPALAPKAIAGTAAAASAPAAEEEKKFVAGPRQILQLLATALAYGEDVEESVKEDGLTELVVLAHHAELGELLSDLGRIQSSS
jgi:hypothetical protein